MQTASRINQDDIRAAADGSLQSIIGNGAGITIHLACNDRYIQTICPDLQLVNCGGTVCISRHEHDGFTLLFIFFCQFGDSRGLSGAINAHYQDYVGFMCGKIQGWGHIQTLNKLILHHFAQIL
ncbi:hypothetical protein SDC9_206555 [bioreactor metagenome]|uniref:Uncharacterized protein n=1 Tax=bioreactor metagenome TaxID=1076179 RepID=A0A645J820_9ZZZZ